MNPCITGTFTENGILARVFNVILAYGTNKYIWRFFLDNLLDCLLPDIIFIFLLVRKRSGHCNIWMSIDHSHLGPGLVFVSPARFNRRQPTVDTEMMNGRIYCDDGEFEVTIWKEVGRL